jgi:hypothetical protein
MRSSELGFTSAKSSGVRDLREKLSGTMHPQPSNADPPKPKPVSEVVKISRREAADEMPARQSKKASKQPSAKKTSQPKVCMHTNNICHRSIVYNFDLFCSPHALNFISWPKAGRYVLLSLFIYQSPALMFGPFGLCCNVVLFFGLCLLHSTTTTYKRTVTSGAFTPYFFGFPPILLQ